MALTLGLDLGSNSIGWALIDSNLKKIIDCGVRIFPEGVENFGDGEREISRNAARREIRQARKGFFKKRLRKKILLQLLSNLKMCPLTDSDILKWKDENKFPDSEELRLWFKLNPYNLRALGVKEKISLAELGRLFYHIAQRRGFQSNSRNVQDKEEGVIYEGKDGKTGILETESHLDGSTLGSYLYSIYPKENSSYKHGLERIRNRYTTRQMYIEEFEAIWAFQKQFHTELTDALKSEIGGRKKEGDQVDGVLFFYRPLKSQKHLIGNCTFEPKKPRCPISSISFEKFRAWQFINSIECNNEKLNPDERTKVFNLLISKEKIEFKEIRKKIGKPDSSYHFNYQDDDKIPGAYTISQLSSKKLWGAKWFDLSEKEQEDIWHALIFFEDKEKLEQHAKNKWGLDDKAAKIISKLQLKKGYGSLSKKAINNILPFLESGEGYDVAVALGGIRNALGDNWKKLGEKNIEFLLTNVPEIVRSGEQGGYIGSLKKMLTEEFGFNETKFSKLYHHSANMKSRKLLSKLPTGQTADSEISSIRNPVVIQSLFELRKVINSVISEHGKIDEIKIELARDLKISKMQRNEIRRKQKKQEAHNDSVIEKLREYGQPISHENILKYKLWEECNHKSPYSDREIGIKQLFSGEVQIEHIFPWSKSLDDSYLNKTICFANENVSKGERTPYQYFTQDFGEEAWENFKSRILKTFYTSKDFPDRYKKFKRLVAEKFNEDFSQRQLNDTRYISREARHYLQKVCDKVNVTMGGITSNLRYHWGLNSILSLDNEKERNDHRHHTVDAIVVACSNANHLNEISRWNRYNKTTELKNFPLPWDNFIQETKTKIESIIVSHKQRDKVLVSRNFKVKKSNGEYTNRGIAARDQLHKDSVYGKRISPSFGEGFHIRKALQDITTKTHVDKIVDSRIRSIIEQRIITLGGYEKGKDIPKNAFFNTDDSGKSKPLIFLPNKNGDAVPVLKVRISETINNAVALDQKLNKFVNPQNNHHMIIYSNVDGKLSEEVISFWLVAERKRQDQPIYQLPDDGKNILTMIKSNDYFLLGLSTEVIAKKENDAKFLSQHLYKVQKIAGGDYFMEICFKKHTDSRQEKDAKKDYVFIKNFGDGKTGWMTHNPIKVKISVTGKIIAAKVNA